VVEVGETVIGFVISPVFHEYVSAPEAVKVADDPEVMVGELTVTFKSPLTVTVAIANPEHPLSVAVTVYEVLLEGEIVIEEVFSPELHEYVVLAFPAVAVKVAEPPEQMVSELTATVNDGPIVTVATAVFEHP
jgi:hypothetical protein